MTARRWIVAALLLATVGALTAVLLAAQGAVLPAARGAVLPAARGAVLPVARGAGGPVIRYDVVRLYPHDPEAFTQGLIYRDGFLFESTGLNGRSSLRKVRLETGEVVQSKRIDTRYFAEGLTDWGTRLVQLTYKTNVAF